MYFYNLYIIFINFILIVNADELFKQNIGKDMEIGLPDGGYKNIKLKCGSDSMHVDLETEDDFSGVIYTRGSFHDRESPCFLDPGYKRGQRSFSINFPLHGCKTLKDGDVFSNVLIVQNDKELILPGDAAFNLECDFRNPRNITVAADLQKSSTVVSKITITSPDIVEDNNKREKRATAENNSDTVQIKLIRKDEL